MVMAEASKTLTPVILELGGKDPFVLLKGSNIEAVVHSAARGGWGASGQNCIGAERFFVHTSLVDACEALKEIASDMRQGPPNDNGNTGIDIGALCLPGEAQRIKGLVDDATAHGAWVVTGGSPYTPPGATGEGGQFFPPTLILVPDPTGRPEVANMRLLQEEVFGPLITVIPFTSEEQLIRLVNGCPFALGSSASVRPILRSCASAGSWTRHALMQRLRHVLHVPEPTHGRSQGFRIRQVCRDCTRPLRREGGGGGYRAVCKATRRRHYATRSRTRRYRLSWSDALLLWPLALSKVTESRSITASIAPNAAPTKKAALPVLPSVLPFWRRASLATPTRLPHAARTTCCLRPATR